MVFKFNNYELTFDDAILDTYKDGEFAMKNETSYVEKFIKKYKTSKHYREVLLPLKLQCLFNIKDVIGGRYNTYLDLLAGIGISGKIFQEKHSNLNDFCPECYKILCNNFSVEKGVVNSHDMYDLSSWQRTYDLIFLDFNNFTVRRFLKDYFDIVTQAFIYANKYVLINDCSVFYLKYGAKSYETYSVLLGKKITNTQEYYIALKDFFKVYYPDWSLVIVEAFKDTSFLLFTKGDTDGLQVTINDKEHLNVKTSLNA